MSDLSPKQLGMDKWTAAEMAEAGNLALLKSLVQDYSSVLNQGDCQSIFSALSGLLLKHQAGLDVKTAAEYNNLIKFFGILSWHSRSEEEKKAYLTKDLILILSKPLPIMALVSQEIFWYKWVYQEILDRCLEHMNQNFEQLGGQNQGFNFSGSNKPLIKNWLKDYIVFSGSSKQLNALNFMEYFNQNKNVKFLKPEELRILKRLLKLYTIFSDPLKNSNFFQQPYLFDDYFETGEVPGQSGLEILKEQGYDFGRVRPKAKAGKESGQLADIASKYSLILKELEQRYEINKGGDNQNISVADLFNLIKGNVENPKVALPALKSAIKKDQDLKTLSALAGNDQARLIKTIKDIVLKSGLSEEQAAVYFIHLAKINRKLIGLAYADLKDGIFRLK